MKYFQVFILILASSGLSFTQDNSWKLYDDSQLAEIHITTAPEVLDFLYREENQQSDSLHFATVHFKNAFIDEIIDSVGFRLRGNTSRAAQKNRLNWILNILSMAVNFMVLINSTLMANITIPLLSALNWPGISLGRSV